MLTKYLILVLLPTVVYSHMKIIIKPNQQGTDATVELVGDEKVVVSDNDRKIFKIDDETLKRASKEYMGKRCGDVYVKPPTPWGDVFSKFGWDVVTKTVKPLRAKVIGVSSKPDSFGTAEYVNNHHSIDVTYSTSVTQEVAESVSHTWSQGGEVGIGQEITYEVNFGAGSVGGSTSLSYTASWGEESTKERKVTLGSTSSVMVKVPPHHLVLANLLATRGTMDIEITYKSYLQGRVFCNYPDKFNGHYFYSMPVTNLQRVSNSPTEVLSKERISIGFYTNVRIEVSNGTYVG